MLLIIIKYQNKLYTSDKYENIIFWKFPIIIKASMKILLSEIKASQYIPEI